MPPRIQAIQARYPRVYMPYARGGGAGAGGNENIIKAISGAIAANKQKALANTQDAIANRLMNTATPPRAALVNAGVNPQTGQPNVIGTGVPTSGSAPITGGMPEVEVRQQLQKLGMGDFGGLGDQLQKAKIAAQLALVQQRTGGGGGGGAQGGNAARWQQYLGGGGQSDQGKGGKPPPYQIGSDANTNLDADKFPNVQADFDAKYGKGSYAKIAPNLPNAKVDAQGNYTISGPDTGDPNKPAKTLMTLPAADANYWLSRYNAASVRSGQKPLFTDKFPSANPGSGQDVGTAANPYKPANQLEARSLPYDSYFVDPATGQVGKKGPPDQSTQPPPAGQEQQKTSATDSGAQQQQQQQQQGDQLAQQGNQQGAQQGSQVAVMPPPAQQSDQGGQGDQSEESDRNAQLAMNTPAPPNLSIGVGTDTTGAPVPDAGSQYLADAIARSRAQNQLTAAA